MLRWPEAKSGAKALCTRVLEWMRRKESGRQPSVHGRNVGRIVTGVAGGILCLIAVFVVVLATLDWNAMRGPVSRYLSSTLNRPVTIEGDLGSGPIKFLAG